MSLDPEQWILLDAGLREDPLVISRTKGVELLKISRKQGAIEGHNKTIAEVCEWLRTDGWFSATCENSSDEVADLIEGKFKERKCQESKKTT